MFHITYRIFNLVYKKCFTIEGQFEYVPVTIHIKRLMCHLTNHEIPENIRNNIEKVICEKILIYVLHSKCYNYNISELVSSIFVYFSSVINIDIKNVKVDLKIINFFKTIDSSIHYPWDV